MAFRRFLFIAIVFSASAWPDLRAAASDTPGIAVVTSPEWCGGDSVREGASEFGLLYAVAREQRAHRAVGIIGVGNRHGLFPASSEQSLHYFALRGMVVAKLARGSDLVEDPDGLFVDAGNLREREAAQLLSQCLQRFGAPPVASETAPTKAELDAIRDHLTKFRQAFLLAQHALNLVAAR